MSVSPTREKAKEAWGKTKETTKKAWGKTKETTKKGWEKTKKTYGETQTDWKKAYHIGYKSGAGDYEYISTRFGSHMMAAIGYKNGLRDAHRTAKHLKKIQNQQEQTEQQ